MKLKNVLIAVKDVERARRFYHDLFGPEMILDNDGNMILTEGLVLQDERIWKNFLGRGVMAQAVRCFPALLRKRRAPCRRTGM